MLEVLKDATKETVIAAMSSVAGRFRVAELSDVDKRELLERSLGNMHDEDFVFVVAVFDERVIYYNRGKMFQRSYSIEEDSNRATFGDEVVEVTPRTDFIAVTADSDEEEKRRRSMSKDVIVKGLIENPKTRFGEDDKEFLDGLDEEQLAKLAPVEETEEEDGEKKKPETEAEGAGSDADGSGEGGCNSEPVTVESYLEGAPEEIRGVLSESISLRKARHAEMVEQVKKSPRNSFSEDALKAMDMATLESVAKLAEVETFEGRPVPTRSTEKDDDKPQPAPKMAEMFKPKANGASA